MTRHAVLLSTLFAFVILLAPVFAGGPPPVPMPSVPTPLPVHQTPPVYKGPPVGQMPPVYDQWNQYDQNQKKGGLINLGPTGNKIANIALTAAGTIVAGLFGSQFGMIGTVIGGAVGLFVSRWIANKLFSTATAKTADFNYGQQYWTGGPPQWNQFEPKKDSRFSNVNGSLKDLQRRFVSTYNKFKSAIASGNKNEETSAKEAYDHAREAYYSAKNGSFR